MGSTTKGYPSPAADKRSASFSLSPWSWLFRTPAIIVETICLSGIFPRYSPRSTRLRWSLTPASSRNCITSSLRTSSLVMEFTTRSVR